jgi:hypothetical protein
LKRCKQLRSNLAATRLEEITELAEQALALTARGWYSQYINREAAKVGVFRSKICPISYNVAAVVLLLRPL